MSLEELLQGLDELTSVESQDGFLDAQGWAKVWKTTEKTASRAIAKLVHAGRMIVRKIHTTTITGATYWKPVYGVKKNEQDRDESDVQSGEVQGGTDGTLRG